MRYYFGMIVMLLQAFRFGGAIQNSHHRFLRNGLPARLLRLSKSKMGRCQMKLDIMRIFLF